MNKSTKRKLRKNVRLFMRTFARYFRISENDFADLYFLNLQKELRDLQEIDGESGLYVNRYFTNMRELLISKYGIIEHISGAKYSISAHKSKLAQNKPQSFETFFNDCKDLSKRFNMLYRFNKLKNNSILKL